MRWYLARLVFVTVACTAACKSRQQDPPVASGSSAGSAAAQFIPAPGGDASQVTVKVLSASRLPAAIERYTLATQEHFTPVSLIEVSPETPTPTRGRLELAMPELPAGTKPDQLRAVVVGKFVLPEDAPITVGADGRLSIALEHQAHVLVLAPIGGVQLLGTPAKILRGTTQMLTQDACAEWLTPGSPRIAALAKDPSGFAIGKDGALAVGAKLTAQVVDAGGELAKPDEVLSRGGGNDVNLSVVLGSLLLAQKHIVGLVVGYATFPDGPLTGKGLWQWAITIVDGKRYFVDARDPAKPMLVPLDEATSKYNLQFNRFCTRTPDGTPANKSVWAADAGVAGVGSGSGAPTLKVTKPN